METTNSVSRPASLSLAAVKLGISNGVKTSFAEGLQEEQQVILQ